MKKLKEYWIELLSKKEYSAKELMQKARNFEIPQLEKLSTMEELQQMQLQSDDRYANSWIREWNRQGKGTYWILQKLKTKGIFWERSRIDEKIAEDRSVGDRYDQLRQQLDRRYPNYKTDYKIRTKALAFLLRRGHSMDDAKNVLQHVIQVESELSDFEPELME